MSVFTLSASQLEARIRKTALDNRMVNFSNHARAQMRRRHIPADVVLEVLRQGRIRRTPEPNLLKGSVECLMERFVAGLQTGVVAAVSDEHPQVIVVSAMHTGGST